MSTIIRYPFKQRLLNILYRLLPWLGERRLDKILLKGSSRAKLGYIAVGQTPRGTDTGDWDVWLHGECLEHVPAADDIEGYYIQYILVDGVMPRSRDLRTRCVHAPIRFVYKGKLPHYLNHSIM